MNIALLSLLAAALAGVASTLLELWWFRQASVVLPGTLPAMALVVPAFLGAWCLGSAVAGRFADRSPVPLATAGRWFGFGTLAAVALPRLLDALLPALPPDGLVARLVIGALPAAPAAFCLAGALPLLSAARERFGVPAQRATGGVACAVALGGAAGCLALPSLLLAGAGAVLPAAGALLLAALLCLALQALADPPGVAPLAAHAAGTVAAAPDGAPDAASATGLRTSPIGGPRRVEFDPDTCGPWGGPRAWLLLGGALLVAGQLALLRLDVQWHGDSLVTGAEVLGGLHLGMALGAGLLAWLPRAVPPGALMALALSLTGAGLAWAPHWLPPSMQLSPGWLAVALLAPLGAGVGSLVTAASRLAPTRDGARGFGRWIGDLSALSTLGGLLGGAWYVWIAAPADELGTPGALSLCAHIAAAGGVLVGVTTLLRPGQPAGLRLFGAGVSLACVLTLLGVMAADPAELPWRAAPDELRLIARSEGPRGVVTLVETADGGTRLKRDFLVGLGGTSSGPLDRRMGRLAAAFAPDAERALLLGVGMGHTLAGLAAVTRARVEGLEHDQRILDLDLPVPLPPGVRPPGGMPQRLHAEARAFLAAHPDTYDLIVGDLFVPWITGAGDLLVPEQFGLVRRALTEDGVYVQWLPLHQIPWPAFGAIVEAFREVFPDVRLFVATPLSDVPLVALVGGLNLLPDPAAVDALLGAAPSVEGPNDMGGVYDSYVTDAWSLRARFADGVANSRRQPWSELWSMRRHDDEAYLARTNLALLGTLAQSLDASSLERTPPDEKQRRALGVELTGRAAALQSLLLARAGSLDLAAKADVPVSDVEDFLLPVERDELAYDVQQALLRAWVARPGDAHVRAAIEQRCVTLAREGLFGAVGSLLEAALAVHGDGRLAGAYGGVLLRVGEDAKALAVLRLAADVLPDDRTVLLHFGSALVRNGQDAEALAVFERLAAMPPRTPLPPLQAALLGVLSDQPGAVDEVRALLEAFEADEPWELTLRRLVDQAGA